MFVAEPKASYSSRLCSRSLWSSLPKVRSVRSRAARAESFGREGVGAYAVLCGFPSGLKEQSLSLSLSSSLSFSISSLLIETFPERKTSLNGC
jgi:hypothetical protein